MAATNWTAVGSLATAALVFLALATAAVTVWMARRGSQDQRMAQAFLLLTGDTQKRTAGIALLAGKVPKRWRDNALQLMVGQAVYLLRKSDSKARPDEVMNLENLVGLVAENSHLTPLISEVPDRSKTVCEKLQQAISFRLGEHTPEDAEISESGDEGGLHIAVSKLKEWQKNPALGGVTPTA